MKLFKLIALVFLSNMAFGQSDVFRADFKNLEDGGPILYAKIMRPNGDARLTNVNGYVQIPIEPGEKLVVSHLNFDTLVIDPTEYANISRPTFYLTPRVYELREFKFSVLGPRHLFDTRFVKNDLGKTDQEKVREKLEIKDMLSELRGLDRAAQSGAVLGSPITALYEKYSRAGKERQKYRELIAQDKRDSIAMRHYDQGIVMALTNYDLEESQRFMEFCSFSKSYISSVETLSLYLEILQCKKEYIEKEW